MAFPNYTYPAYGAYNPVTPFAAPQVYQPQQTTQQPSQAIQAQGSVNTQPAFFCRLGKNTRPAGGVHVFISRFVEIFAVQKSYVRGFKHSLSAGKLLRTDRARAESIENVV